MFCNLSKSLIILICLFTSVFLKAEKRKLTFFRPVSVGQHYDCSLTAENLRQFTVVNSATSQEKVDKNTLKVNLDGKMIVKAVLHGHSSKMLFKVDNFSATQNGKKIESNLTGKTLVIDVSNPKGSKLSTLNKSYKLSEAEQTALYLLFRPVSKTNLNDLMGTDEPVSVGSSWPAPTQAIIGAFKKRGVNIKPEQIQGTCEISDSGNYQSYKIVEIKEDIKVTTIPNFYFTFNALVWLPENTQYGPIRIERNAYEKAEKALTDPQNPFSQGMKIKAIISESFKAFVLPAAKNH